jgi:hypothetical protein
MHSQTFTLPAGTICKRGGIPFMLMTATLVECHPANWALIRDGFRPSVCVDGVEYFGDPETGNRENKGA